MSEQTKTRMTAEAYFRLPLTNQRTELIDGELTVYGENPVSPAPLLDHPRLIVKLIALLTHLISNGELLTAPTDVYLDDANIVQPDIFWVAEQSACKAIEGRYFRGAPDLVIEVFSPGTVSQDRKKKFKLYQQYGVREYWMADPAEQYLEIHRLENGKFVLQDVYGPGESFASAVLGKQVDLQGLFGALA